MKPAFLLRFQESCVEREASRHNSRTIVRASLFQGTTVVLALHAGTSTHTRIGHEASDTDPDRKKFYALPRCS